MKAHAVIYFLMEAESVQTS